MFHSKTDNLIGVLLLLNFCPFGLSQSKDAKDDRNMIAKLREDLLVNREYDPMARPVNDSKTTVIVEIKYFGIYSLNLDIVTGALSTNLGMFITWTDEHLTWNKSKYEGLNEIIMDTNQVWLPSFQAWNSIYSASHFGDIRIGANHPFVRVFSNGTVIFEPKPYLTTKCFIDLTLYPKDEQHCFLLLGSFLEHVPELNITLAKDYFCKFYSSVYDCKISDTKQKQYNKEGYPPFFKIQIDLKRKTAFYFYIIDLPFYSAILLNFSTLFLPLNNHNFKLKITTLMFALFIIFFSFSLVFVEIGFHSMRTPYVVKCVMANFVFDVILLILICLINQNIRNPVRSPPAFLSFLQHIPILSRSTLRTSITVDEFYASESVKSDKSAQYANEWINLASVLDKIALIILIGLLVVYHP